MVCGVPVPQPGIKPAPTALEAQSPNHCTARQVPLLQPVNLIGMPDFYVKSPNLYLRFSHSVKSPCEQNKTRSVADDVP